MNKALSGAEPYETAAMAAVHLFPSSAHLPPVWLSAPFILLLFMIATGPLFYPHIWERHYAKISIGFGGVVAAWYVFFMEQGIGTLRHTFEEYISFIALITALFVTSGGILVKIQRRGNPVINGALLFFGALLSNLIGTTGASMLLIRPYMRINQGRIRPFHIVFFIFIVGNIGGALTPVGDPPLFLGFLKGVPFFWVVSKLWLPWLITVIGLLLLFMVFDTKAGNGVMGEREINGGVSVVGAKSIIFLPIVIGAVFLDPAVIAGFPSLQALFHLPFGIREVILFSIAFAAYKTADREALKGNEFNFSPLKEVSFLFAGIFATMVPALELMAAYAASHAGEFSVTRFYWMTGALSGVLDNAPTYMNFFAGALGKFGMHIGAVSDVKEFAGGIRSTVKGDVTSDIYLMAISLASVFFGAMTYIGNAPNFMVKNIALQADVDVPGFFEYLYKYSLPILLPFFALIWWLFFHF
jgi:Na+/H+ antiporter NhaD/arsenite permease-like protein